MPRPLLAITRRSCNWPRSDSPRFPPRPSGSLDQRKEQIDALLKPMRELMDQYQIRVGEIEKSRVESYSMLREQLGALAESQRTLNTQTSQLGDGTFAADGSRAMGRNLAAAARRTRGAFQSMRFRRAGERRHRTGAIETRHGRQFARPTRHRDRLQDLFRRLPRRRRRNR